MDICRLSTVALELSGPLMLACLAIMYMSVTATTGQRPPLNQVIYRYVTGYTKRKGHAGIVTYVFVLCFMTFFVAFMGFLYCAFAKA